MGMKGAGWNKGGDPCRGMGASEWGQGARVMCCFHRGKVGQASSEPFHHTYIPCDHPVGVPDQGMQGGPAVGKLKEGHPPDWSQMGGGQERLPQKFSPGRDKVSPGSMAATLLAAQFPVPALEAFLCAVWALPSLF